MSQLDDTMIGTHPKVDLARRGFIVTSLATGFAAAVMPVSAETISTDSSGLTAGEVKVPTRDGSTPAYRAMPVGKTSLPVVIVVQEIFGVHEHIKDLCRRLAKEGYFAVAPDLYARHGDPTQYPAAADIIANVVSKVPGSEVLADLDATLAWAVSNGGNPDRVGITGFCWGGRQVWLYAAHSDRIKAGVAWYGPLAGTPTENMPKFPVDIAKDLKAPVLGLYGGKDQGITAEHVIKMREALKSVPAAAADSQIVVFPESGHGFNADYRPSYNEKDAKEAWARMLAFLRQHGVG